MEEAIYEDADLADRLGNMILLPSDANSYLGKRVWAHKSLLYRYFACEPPQAEALQAAFAGAGLEVSLAGVGPYLWQMMQPALASSMP